MKNSDTDADALFNLCTLGVFLATFATAPFFEGWVVCKLWSWFIIPQFHLAPLRLGTAIGMGILISLMTAKAPTPKQKGGEEEEHARFAWRLISFAWLTPTISLIVGGIFERFV